MLPAAARRLNSDRADRTFAIFSMDSLPLASIKAPKPFNTDTVTTVLLKKVHVFLQERKCFPEFKV